MFFNYKNARSLYFYIIKLVPMIKYTSADQLTIEKFKTPFEINLYRYNRLVKLSQIIPWDEREAIETKEEQTIGNNIEGKFGQEKTAYNRARIHTAKSSESWSVCLMFSMKLIKFIKIFLFSFAKWFKNRWGRFFLCLSRSKN